MCGKVRDQVLRARNISAEAMARHSKSFRFGNASYRTSSRTNKLRILGGQKKVGLRRRTDGHKKFRRTFGMSKLQLAHLSSLLRSGVLAHNGRSWLRRRKPYGKQRADQKIQLC